MSSTLTVNEVLKGRCRFVALVAAIVNLFPLGFILIYLYYVGSLDIPSYIRWMMPLHPVLIAAVTGLGYVLGGAPVMRRRRVAIIAGPIMAVVLLGIGSTAASNLGFLAFYIVFFVDLALVPIYFVLAFDTFRVVAQELCRPAPISD